MKYCIIPPLSNLELMNQGTMIFALAQLYYRHEKYSDFINKKKEEGWFIVFDNGTGDHDLIDDDTLLELVDILRPNEVIVPDILFDKDATIEHCKTFVDKMYERDLIDKVNVFYCPQGHTQDEWLESYQFGLDNPYVKTIGLSKLSVPQCWLPEGYDKDQNVMQGRIKCYDFLKANGLIKKPIHCLGAGNPLEFMHYTGDKLIRSTDSCFSVLAAMNNYNWKSMQFTRIPTPKNYFTEMYLREDQLDTFRDNVEILADMCK